MADSKKTEFKIVTIAQFIVSKFANSITDIKIRDKTRNEKILSVKVVMDQVKQYTCHQTRDDGLIHIFEF